ncbi:MAG: hypothetical protein V1794_00165, partial [Candidatus Glassbacteria bacterium]
MSKINRRSFITRTAIGATGASVFLSCEEKALMDKPAQLSKEPPVKGLQTGKIGSLTLTRLMCGGNLISGFAHARDLIYASSLIVAYHTDDKILDTIQLCEENGINTAVLRCDEKIAGLLKRYRKERGGKIQWLAQTYPKPGDLTSNIQLAIDNGAIGGFVQGGISDKLVTDGMVDTLGEINAFVKKNGLISGFGGHALEVPKAVEEAGIDNDFYMKTLHTHGYWSAMPDVEEHDNLWCTTPAETVEFMKSVNKPWLAYKVLGAGAIHPREGFRYAFESGADFVVAGMFDFQVREDVIVAMNLLSKNIARERAWKA